MYDPKLVDTLKYQVTTDIVAGEAHSACLSSLYRLTITGSSQEVALSPFSLLGLPVGRVDLANSARQPVTPPNTTLQLHAFASAKLMQVSLPLRQDPGVPWVNTAEYSAAELQESIVLIDRGLWEGEWLKLETTDFDFGLKLSPLGAKLPSRTGVTAQIMFGVEGKWEASTDCADKVCVFECPAALAEKTTPEELSPTIVDLAVKCQQGQGFACIFILPKNMEPFPVEVGPASAPEGLALQQIPFGVISHEHGAVLKKHITRLINMRIAEAPDGVPEDVQDWQECREDFTGRVFYENVATGQKRWAPPQINPNTHATLLVAQEDSFLPRLQAILELAPKGVIVCQQSWKPDVELVALADAMLEQLAVPIVLVTYEAGEELKSVVSNGSNPWVTLEVQPFGGVCAWGNGTYGQLGLAGIENQNHLTRAQNVLTSESNLFANRPCYVAHLHEHQVTSVACGTAHTLAVTQQGEVFSWGASEALGVPVEQDQRMSEVPTFVEPLEGLVRANKAYAGHYHSFVLGDLPFRSIV